jgi:ubiquinone/menaquinone biosynthesis C-methylase UbiE
MNSWHYQSDGWLSPASAAVYEASTETLFLGRQDAMQRAGLALLCHHLARPTEEAEAAAPLRILDVGAGTGRFMTFVRDSFPSADVMCLDLSPFYLAEAREGHAHWEALRGAAATGRRTGAASFVQAAAEAQPLDDASFDAVTCVYLMHELPPAVRAAVASELARVLRPGGVCVLTDSVQLGDRPAMDARLGQFGSFNEVRACNVCC